jgi:hypothetical protein
MEGSGFMPELSRFYGIVIKMYFAQSEHDPPHIHAIYNDRMGAVDIHNGHMIEGDLPAKALAMVREWLALNREGLLEIWRTQQYRKLPPLE